MVTAVERAAVPSANIPEHEAAATPNLSPVRTALISRLDSFCSGIRGKLRDFVNPALGYDPAGKENIFWLPDELKTVDWNTYFPADPSKLPADQQTQIDLMEAAQTQREKQILADSTIVSQATNFANDGKVKFMQHYLAQYRALPEVGKIKGWAVTVAVDLAVGIAALGGLAVKYVRREKRPFQVDADPKITTVGPQPSDPSYPSGHSLATTVWSTLIGAAAPSLKADVETAARNVKSERIWAGDHFPGDVAKGTRMGTWFARLLVPIFQRLAPKPAPSEPAAPQALPEVASQSEGTPLAQAA
jgi:hypothetical protein